MSNTAKTYLGIGIVFGTSLALPYFFPNIDFAKYAAVIGALVALVATIFQLLRDQIIHDRALLIMEANNRFSLGASSHMANIAFDKHVAFCEEYVAEMQKTLSTLFREGPSDLVLTHAHLLGAIQDKYRLWLTPEIDEYLETYEKKLRKVGAGARLIKMGPAEDYFKAKDRQKIIDDVYKTYTEVTDVPNWHGGAITEEQEKQGTASVINRFRAVLGTSELTCLRKLALEKAIR